MRRTLSLAIACAALAAGDGACAQTQAQTRVETGSLIDKAKPAEISDSTKLSPAQRARRTTFEFAQCVMLRSTKQAHAILFVKDDTARHRGLVELATGKCLQPGTLKMTDNLMLGAIFRAFYIRDYARVQSPLPESRLDYRALELGAASDDASVLLREFGDCIVRADLGASRDLVLADPGTAREAAALKQLAPKLGPCMPAGLTVKFSVDVLVGILSEVLYFNSRATALKAVNGGVQ